MVPSKRPGITSREEWRDDVVAVTRELGPPMMRWGGIFADFYRWREGVGPREARPAMLNLLWGGIESNQVGTGEFVDLCRRVGAEPLICVNFESDGRQQYMKFKDQVRTADAKEAAAWVSYCNHPANRERKAHGLAAPLGVRHWQIGNETSYDRNGFDLETAARKTVEFARAMRAADPAHPADRVGRQRMGGAHGGGRRRTRAIPRVSSHVRSGLSATAGAARRAYRRDPDETWEQLMTAWQPADAKIRTVRESLGAQEHPARDDGMPFRDSRPRPRRRGRLVGRRCLLRAHPQHPSAARRRPENCDSRGFLRHALAEQCGDHSDAEGQQPRLPAAGRSRHAALSSPFGSHAIKVAGPPDGLDVVASRRGDTVYLHVANTRRTRAVDATIQIAGHAAGADASSRSPRIPRSKSRI